MMGTCVFLFIMAWALVRLWSVPAAIAMCLVAMVIPPVAAIVANRRGPEDRWWDEPAGDSGDPESDAWWAELDGKRRKDRNDDHPRGQEPPQGGRRPEQGPQ